MSDQTIDHIIRPDNVLAVYRKLKAAGYCIIPLQGKEIRDVGWQTREYSEQEMQARIMAGGNIGMVFGQRIGEDHVLIGIDVDIEDKDLSNAAWRAIGGYLPIRYGKVYKFLLVAIVRWADGYNRDFYFYNAQGARIGIQILGRGQRAPAGPKQAVCFGMHPGTGAPYKWVSGENGSQFIDMKPTDWPVIDNFDGMIERVTDAMVQRGWTPRAKYITRSENNALVYDGAIPDWLVKADREHLDRVIAELSRAVPGSRGSRAYHLGLEIGVQCRRGNINLEDTIARIRDSMPDNTNAPREFERGAMASDGGRQKLMMQKATVDWVQEAALRGIDLNPQKEAEDDAKDTYKRPLLVGVCDLLAGAQRERDPARKTREEDIGRSFVASMLAAGIVTRKELDDEWIIKSNWLGGINLQRYGGDVTRIAQELATIQPTEEGWAIYAASLMARGQHAPESIRAAQHAHRAREKLNAEEGLVEAEILASIGMADWDRDLNGDADSGTFSNFKFFMAGQLFVWPFFDDFSERLQFRRLVKFGDARDVVPDATLKRWGHDRAAAAVEIYALARDRTHSWGQANYSPNRIDIDLWIGALVGDGARRRFNSISDKIGQWEAWDGQQRLWNWLARYTETMPWEADYEYVCMAGAHFVRNWVYKLENPGHKHDEVLILVGLQGERKTTLFGVLADAVAPGSYLAGQRLDYDGSTGINRMAEATIGKTLVEMAELTSLGRRDMENIKALISQTTDSGRRSYGATSVDRPRQFGIVGTANCRLPDMYAAEATVDLLALPAIERNKRKREMMAVADLGFLTDQTGNRRFQPVKINAVSIDLEALAREAPQLIAEARAEVAIDRRALLMPETFQVAAAKAEQQFHASAELEDDIRAKIIMPMEGTEDYRILLADARTVLGLDHRHSNGQGAARFKRSLALCGLEVRRSGPTWVFKGDWAKVKRIPLSGASGVVRLAPEIGVVGG